MVLRSALLLASFGLAAAQQALPSVLVVGKSPQQCLATAVLGEWAITTTACALSIAAGAPVQGAVADPSRAPVHLPNSLIAIPVQFSTGTQSARLEPANFVTSGWTRGTLGALQNGLPIGVSASPANVSGLNVLPAPLVAVAPGWTLCSLQDGAPLFVDDLPLGAPVWTEVPLVGIVSGGNSTCTTVAVAPIGPALVSLLSLVPDADAVREEMDNLREANSKLYSTLLRLQSARIRGTSDSSDYEDHYPHRWRDRRASDDAWIFFCVLIFASLLGCLCLLDTTFYGKARD